MQKRYWKYVLWVLVNTVILLVLARLSHGTTQEKLKALTFDDGPGPYVYYGLKINTEELSGTQGLLRLLDLQRVRATFFYMDRKRADEAQKQDKYFEAAK